MFPAVAFTETVPHCINRPLGNLLWPVVAILGVPKFIVVAVSPTKVEDPVTTNAPLAVMVEELAIITFAVEFALNVIVLPVEIIIAGPLVFPVPKVKLVIPFTVLIEVVVNDDMLDYNGSAALLNC